LFLFIIIAMTLGSLMPHSEAICACKVEEPEPVRCGPEPNPEALTRPPAPPEGSKAPSARGAEEGKDPSVIVDESDMAEDGRGER
jgi:hypothetical protein